MKQLLQNIARLPLGWYLGGITIIAVGLRLISITKASIWHDEGFTMMIIKEDIASIVERTIRDVHPPLYYIVTHLWSSLFGTSELAIRSLSLAFGVGIVILIYFIVKRLRFSEGTARLATLFAALGPFLVRYSEEARMYSMAAFLVCAATLALLIAFDMNSKKLAHRRLIWWIVYGVIMAAALYTHYYAVFIIPVHIGFAIYKGGGFMSLIKDKFWWIGNSLAALLFIPWIPNLISQFTRVQSGFWIPPVDAETIPNTLMQFTIFNGSTVPSSIEMLLMVGFVGVLTALIILVKKRAHILFVVAWAFLPLLMVLLASLKQPVYYDRYFVYCSVAFYILLAIIVTHNKLQTWIKSSIAGVICLILAIGIFNIHDQADHQMRDVGNLVSSQYQPGDVLVSAELYTYFDFSYYNQTNSPVKLLSEGPLGGYGETSLIYDKQDEIVVHTLSDIKKSSDQTRIWVVGKTGQHDYFAEDIPASWTQLEQFEAGDSAVRLYSL